MKSTSLNFHWLAVTVTAALVLAGHAADPNADDNQPATPRKLDPRLKEFALAKARQARSLADTEGQTMAAEVWPYFEAAGKGDWSEVRRLYGAMRRRAYQFEGTRKDKKLETVVWQPINEVDGAVDAFVGMDGKFIDAFGKDVIQSIPAGSIYFGGTDPGRFLITALTKSHATGEPFFTLTQNALADGLYLKYLRLMYGSKIYTPTDQDSQRAFQEYLADAEKRLKENKLRPGEDVRVNGSEAEEQADSVIDEPRKKGKVQVSGQVAVMSINGLIAKTIFERNPEREFYVEESFPLDWMYPHLTPNGLIMKINRQPLSEIPEATVRRDREYWNKQIAWLLGDVVKEQAGVPELCEFIDQVYVRRDLAGFKGDRAFVESKPDRDPQRLYSKLRAAIGGVYAWRVANAKAPGEKQRMTKAADFAFRQAVALCPNSPEAIFRYVNRLIEEKRLTDAQALMATVVKLQPGTPQFRQLKSQVDGMK